MKLTMLNATNQVIPVYLGDHLMNIALRLFKGVLFATIEVDGEVVVASRRVVFGENIFGYKCNETRYGLLRLMRKYDSDVADTKAYNEAIYLDFESPVES